MVHEATPESYTVGLEHARAEEANLTRFGIRSCFGRTDFKGPVGIRFRRHLQIPFVNSTDHDSRDGLRRYDLNLQDVKGDFGQQPETSCVLFSLPLGSHRPENNGPGRVLQVPDTAEMDLHPRAKAVENGVQGARILAQEPVRGGAHLRETHLDQHGRFLIEEFLNSRANGLGI
jgi:hypothetical protein